MTRIVDIYEPDSIANELIKAGWEVKDTPIDDLYELYTHLRYEADNG